ncbi:MAG: nickel-dependent hydrogenase large subunit [Clostridia bacterium]|nr:nickel-dependent hydrogenase large subunit [Clostridia bacterium]
MGKRTIVPFGPQHPVLPEPIHLDLVLEDEKVIEAIPSIGFVHRGLESLISKRDFNDYLYVIERTCGICSFMHGMGYCEAVERIFDVEIPDRAKYLRTIWCEMSRLHSHLLWLGLLADAFGFEALFYQCWRMREKILDMFEASTGGRVIFSVNKVGGVLKDMDSAMLKGFVAEFDSMEADVRKLTKVFLKDYTVKSRLKDVGILTKEEAIQLGAVGPMMRASGIELDTRRLGYCAYGDLDFDIITSNDCDSFGRCKVRIEEIFQSFSLIRQAVDKIPEGNIVVPVKGNPDGEAFVRVEQPRGEAIYYVKANGTKFLDRARVRTPTFTNLSPLIKILQGCDYADVPLLILTIDPCISCTER